MKVRDKNCIIVLFILLIASLHPVFADELESILANVRLDSLLTTVRILSGEMPVNLNGEALTIQSRYSDQPGNAQAADWLLQTLKRWNLPVSLQEVPYNGLGQNVIAEQRGFRFPNQKYILCAHYDCMPAGPVAHGADDNASGTAAVIEAARLMAGQPVPYTIVYALWDQEEQGLIGSKYYAGQAAAGGDSILGVINLDMIAWDGDNNMEADLQVRDIANSVYLAERMAELNDHYQVGLSLHRVIPGTGSSDHASFWEHFYSAFLLIEDFTASAGVRDFNPYYHTVRDRIYLDSRQIFNFVYFTRCSQLAIATLASYALDLAPAVPVLARFYRSLPVRTPVKWPAVPRATGYQIQIARDEQFLDTIASLETAVPVVYLSGLNFDDYYYLRVRGRDRAGSSIWSSPEGFMTLGPDSQNIALKKGWHLVSSGVAQIDSALKNLIITPTGALDLMRDDSGKLYWPARNIDEIREWRRDRSYWVHLASDAALKFKGAFINAIPTPLALRPGWNNLAFWPAQSLPLSSAFESLKESPRIIKDESGLVSWPEQQIDQIGQLAVGKGYQVYMDAADTLLYPIDVTAKGGGCSYPVVASHQYDAVDPTGANATLLVEADQLPDGYEIAAVLVNGSVIGSGVVSRGRCLLTLWGDDLATINVEEGASESAVVNLVFWSPGDNSEQSLAITRITDGLTGVEGEPPLRYRTDAVGIIRVTPNSGVPAVFTLQQNYPNPFNFMTRLDYFLPRNSHVRLSVFNIKGQLVRRMVDEERIAGFHSERFTADDLSSGLYWAVLEAGGQRQKVKMMLVR